MFNNNYTNFVRPKSPETFIARSVDSVPLTGEQAKQLYLDEIKQKDPSPRIVKRDKTATGVHELQIRNLEISDKDLFLSVQNEDVDTLKMALDASPDSVNKLDDFGWSLLMIACQSNSIECAKELIKRGVDTSVRDRAGNSAQSLIIKNKNHILADVILSAKSTKEAKSKVKKKPDKHSPKDFFCDICNIQVNDRDHHLSSTVHNLNLSKGKKLPANYVIPESNKGYQIMLKVGWDKESGLGPDGSGKKYPIKTVQKQDRKGLGHSRKLQTVDKKEENIKYKNRKMLKRDYEFNRIMEINFRRQFY